MLIRNDTDAIELVRMSKRDLKCLEVLSEVQVGRRTVGEAASVLGVSELHAYRLLARYQEDGGFALAHKAQMGTLNRSHTGLGTSIHQTLGAPDSGKSVEKLSSFHALPSSIFARSFLSDAL